MPAKGKCDGLELLGCEGEVPECKGGARDARARKIRGRKDINTLGPKVLLGKEIRLGMGREEERKWQN